MDTKSSHKKHLLGHRKRLRDRILKNGIDTLADYELLEVALHFTQKRQDTRMLARELLATMHSLTEVFCSDYSKLINQKGIGPISCLSFKIIHEIVCRISKERLYKKSLLNNIERVIEYCNLSMACSDIEQLRIIYLNKKNFMISDEIQQKGTLDHTAIYPREIIKKALDLGAGAFIMIHNHPTGDPSPSNADIEITKQVYDAAFSVEIRLHDHIIIGKYGYFSMKQEGIIN